MELELEDLFDVSEDRVSRLGFKPQQENGYNRLLYYADLLDEEAKLWLTEIKTNLSKAVMLREIQPTCGLWASRLAKYIEIHGLKFSKEDHVAFIHLTYELLTIPNLETYYVDEFCQLLLLLLKKRYLLTRDDLVLEWRPLYDLCLRVMRLNKVKLRFCKKFSTVNHTLHVVIQMARFYFPETATQEILDEIKPKLNPLATLPVSAGFLKWFLPVLLPPEKAHLGYKLWFDDLMELCLKGNTSDTWNSDIMGLMASLASYNIGYIDWEPYIPAMFTKFLHSFNLPVVYKQKQPSKLHSVDPSAISRWIVSVLGGGSSCQMYLDKFLKTIESYFHPANFLFRFLRLHELLRKLPEAFVKRLHHERHRRKRYHTQEIPKSHLLTEEDIDRFVESMKGVVREAIYSRFGCNDVWVALHNLAALRPKMIIPMLIERLYSTVDSLTEPHKLTSLMQCIGAVARSMVQGAKNGYPEGPTHVIPLLMLTLPGIDANDFKKSIVTFHFISVFVSFTPIVDSSKASEYYNLTEEEESICAATANFEDFVVQFFDRIFSFIDSSTLETTRMEKGTEKRSKVEALAESALTGVCFSILSQCSTNIFQIALKKLYAFVTQRIFETKVAGRYLAGVCKKFSRVNPEETLKYFVPYLCQRILSLAESPELQEDILDDEILYLMLILSEILGTRRGTIPYVKDVMTVIDRILELSCLEGHKLASRMLNHLLLSLTSTCPMEHRAVDKSYDLHVKDYLPIRDWGKYGDYNSLNVTWHVPGKEEIECVRTIVWKYLPMQLQRLEKHISDEEPLTREELFCSIKVIRGLMAGQRVFPFWDGEPIPLWGSSLKTTTCYPLTLGIEGEVHMPDGSNIRLAVVRMMDRLQEKLLTCAEDDTKSLIGIIQVLEILLLNKCHYGSDLNSFSKNFQMLKILLRNPLLGERNHVRVMMIDGVVALQQSRRAKAVPPFTETHRLILLNLLRLSCSFYSQVRRAAQEVLSHGLHYYSHSYSVLIPQLLENLQKDSVEHHEVFKGSLYVLLGPKPTPLITMHNWDVFTKIWPTIIKATPSGKVSIINLLESIVKTVRNHHSTIVLEHEVPDSCIERAKALWRNPPIPTEAMASDDDIAAGVKAMEEKNKYDMQQYYSTVDAIMDALEVNNLHWRYQDMGIRFLQRLAHPDVKYPMRVVKMFLHMLINESLELRKMAVRGVYHILAQQQRPYKKIKVDIGSLSPEPLPKDLPPGIRPDNMWLQYNSKTLPRTAEEWDQPRYLHKPNIGYFQWPQDLELFAPSSEQPPLDRREDEMTPEETEVVSFFLNPQNMDQLIKYFSLENRDGKDKLFNVTVFFMFKQLFKNHGDIFLEVLKPHLQELVVDKRESSQRLVAEIIAGMIRGSKHWPFEKVSSMWEYLAPLIRTALENMTEETVAGWAICFASAAKKRDPNRIHWLLEVLMENPLREESSYLGCGRLYALQCALIEQRWRLAELHTRLLEYVRPFLTHPFQNIRKTISGVLSNIFQQDLRIFNAKTVGPRVDEFMKEMTKEVECLYSLAFTNEVNKSGEPCKNLTVDEVTVKMENVKIAEGESEGSPKKQLTTSAEIEVAMRQFKTICNWISQSVSQGSPRAEYYSIFPLLCALESYDQDDEIGSICTETIAVLARSPADVELIPVVFAAIRKVTSSDSWLAKMSAVEFLQVFTFWNMFTILKNPEWTSETTKIVFEMLQDERHEVREKAAEVLGGLLHCDFISDKATLLERFKKNANIRMKENAGKSGKYLRIRHSGILGLCSFINSSPYDVPDCVPVIFSLLHGHLSDPQPIPSSIRKTLNDFKRTHHDNWEVHKLKFTEEELDVLNDMIVPPTYYS